MLYQYPLGILEELCDEILISTCKKLDIEEEYEQVCDDIPGIGPIGGILTCLKRSSYETTIVLSYDLPLIRKEVFDYLLGEQQNYDIVLPALESRQPEPLCGIYRKNALESIQKQVEDKSYAVHKVLPLVHSKTILIKPTMTFYHPDLFMNINHESDLDRIPPELE